MQQKNFRKRQGLSLKTLNPSKMTQSLTQQFKKDQETGSEKSLIKRSNSVTKSHKSHKSELQKKTINSYFRTPKQNLQESKQNAGIIYTRRTKTSKFTKIPLNNPISTRNSQKVERMVDQINPKSKCFYKFGLKSYQRRSQKRVFTDVMNITKDDTKGLMFVGELWSNQLSKNFLKSNGVSTSKMKFFEQLRNLKWDISRKQREKELDTQQLIGYGGQFSQHSQKSIQSFSAQQSMLSVKNTSVIKDMDSDQQERPQTESRKPSQRSEFERNSKIYKNALNSIKSNINEQLIRCKDEEYWEKMKKLEKESSQMHKLWQRYFTNMLEIN